MLQRFVSHHGSHMNHVAAVDNFVDALALEKLLGCPPPFLLSQKHPDSAVHPQELGR